MARKKATPTRRKRLRKAAKKARATRRRQPRRSRPAAAARKRTKAARRRPVRTKARAKGPARIKRIKAKARAGRPSPNARPAGSLRLERERRRLPDAERLEPRPADDARLLSAARAGHDEMKAMMERHTETSPALTAGDVDAKWEDAYAVGDEAPGGDNPTPDQDRVDDIGKALGIQYQDDQELEGGDEVAKRDRRRWELDPASSEDWPHEKKR